MAERINAFPTIYYKKMKNIKHQTLLLIERVLIYLIIYPLHWTFRYNVKGYKKPYPKAIYAFWHKDIIPLMTNRKHEKNVILISNSKDGDFIALPAEMFGYIPVRGSSSKNGISALKEMITLSKKNSLAITPDGPKGPSQEIKDGVLQLAYLSKLPIIATKTKVSKAIYFNSWDKFYIPLPFAKIDIEYSQMYYINSKNEFDTKKKMIEEFMKN